MKKQIKQKPGNVEAVHTHTHTHTNNLAKRNIVTIVLIAIIIFAPYISNKFIVGDDSDYHLPNLYAIDNYINIEENNFIYSKILPVIARDFGYGNGIFYPQLAYCCTTIINLIIKQFGFSLITSVKIFEFMILVLAGYFMYKCINIIFKNNYIALAASIIYITSPYLMYDIFYRMAYSEICIFVFMPIVALAIYYILNEEYKKFTIYFIIGYVGMILSHLVMTVYFTILIILVLLYNWRKLFNKKTILYFLFATVIVLMITSPFTIPMLEHKFMGEYVVFQENTMTNLNKLEKASLEFDDIICGFTKTRGAKYINIVTVILCCVTLINKKSLIQQKIENKVFYSIVIFTLISIILSSKLIDWSKMPKLLWNIQFPWRMCTFIAFGTSIIASLSLRMFENEDVKIIGMILISIFCLYNSTYIIHQKNIKQIAKMTYSEASSTTNDAMGSQKEYLPVNALKNIEYLRTRDDGVIIKQGNAEINIIKDKTPYLEFEIANNNNLVIELPRLFYFGYDIKLKAEDGTKEKINYYENENGFIELVINKNGTITVEYTGTTLNKISNILCIIAIAICVVIFIKNRKNKEEVKC